MSKIYKKQPLDIVVSGITLRYSMKYNIWVNWAGTRAYRKYNDSSWNRFLQIHTDINGSKFLNVKPKTVQLDEAVADAYNPTIGWKETSVILIILIIFIYHLKLLVNYIKQVRTSLLF